tara:strand:- start:738 stop:1706 length:969 start_codon:yes stop_codon:yes gene_type:complete
MDVCQIKHREDRLGACITNYLCQIILADKNNYYIEKTPNTTFNGHQFSYQHSLWIKILDDLVDKINGKSTPTSPKVYKNVFKENWRIQTIDACVSIKSDLLSYVKKHYFTFLNERLEYYAKDEKYNINYDWKNTACIHLRLDDCVGRADYDGRCIADFFKEKINNITTSEDYIKWEDEKNISHQQYEYYGKDQLRYYKERNDHMHNYKDMATPISDIRIQKVIDEIKKNYPTHQIIIVAAPSNPTIEGELTLKADKYIRTSDPNFDLYCMAHSDILVCSRSTYSLSAAYLHKGREIYLPMWGVFGCLGVTSQYNKSNVKLYY